MNFRKFRGLAAVTFAAALVLSGCGSSDDKDNNPSASEEAPDAGDNQLDENATTTDADAKLLSGITFSTPKPNEELTDVKVDADLTAISGPSAVVLHEGTGEVISAGDLAEMQLLVIDPDGGTLNSSYGTGKPDVIPLKSPTFPQLTNAIAGQKVGARIAFASPVPNAEGVTAVDSAVLLEITGIRKVATVEQSDALPQITRDKDNVPAVAFPDGFEATKDIQVVVLKKGDGDVLAETDTISANYTGWQTDGTKFDSSFDRGEPSQFPLQGVIPGWTHGLTGQTVGSEIMLVIPGALGYGEGEGSSETGQPLGPLVFVVDIVEKM